MVDLKKPMNLIYLLITCACPYPQKKKQASPGFQQLLSLYLIFFLTKNWPPNTPAPLTFKRKGRQKLWRLGLHVRLESNEWVRLQSVAKSSLCNSKGYIKVSVREKNIFVLLQKLFLFSRKSKFRILDTPVSHTDYWITLEVIKLC